VSHGQAPGALPSLLVASDDVRRAQESKNGPDQIGHHLRHGPEETARSLALTELDVASGGLVFQFKLVAVKTVSWAHDDETP
jgi:hypothetical protein